jgi:protein OS-9
MADRISLIKETSTCQYLMVISTMRLCHDVAFLPPKASKPHAIACTPVLPESGITSYLADKESQAESDDAAMDAALDDEIIKAVNQLESGQVKKKKQVVGDIEIGAHAVVPLGKKVEKSAVVGGGKETLVATIAKSDGFIASDKEMQRVGIRSNKEIEGVKKEVERVAQGKGWRLDVVQTPRGKELRGIIDDDDDDKKEIKKTTKEAEGLVSPDDAQEEGAPQPTSGSEEDQEGSEETYKEEL